MVPCKCCTLLVIIIIFFFTLGINVPEGGLKKLVKMKRLGMSKIPCGHKLHTIMQKNAETLK